VLLPYGKGRVAIGMYFCPNAGTLHAERVSNPLRAGLQKHKVRPTAHSTVLPEEFSR